LPQGQGLAEQIGRHLGRDLDWSFAHVNHTVWQVAEKLVFMMSEETAT
jgi:hypothetical protein